MSDEEALLLEFLDWLRGQHIHLADASRKAMMNDGPILLMDGLSELTGRFLESRTTDGDTRAEPVGLDVERLAEAIHTQARDVGPWDGMTTSRLLAEAIAAEYARLAAAAGPKRKR